MADKTGEPGCDAGKHPGSRRQPAPERSDHPGSLRHMPRHKPHRNHPDQQAQHIRIRHLEKCDAQRHPRHRAKDQHPRIRPVPASPVGSQRCQINQHQQRQHHAQRQRRLNNQRQNRGRGKGRPRPEPAFGHAGKQNRRGRYGKKRQVQIQHVFPAPQISLRNPSIPRAQENSQNFLLQFQCRKMP